MLALVIAPMSNARAASVDVDVDITLPNFLVLYCYDNISVSFTAAQLEAALGVTSNSATVSGTPTITSAAGTITATLDIATDAPSLTTSANLVLKNVCGVRALSSTGNVSISIPSKADTLTASGGTGTISVGTVAPSTTSLALTGGLGTVNPFDVTMPLDLSGAIEAASYEAASSGVEFVVEVTAP